MNPAFDISTGYVLGITLWFVAHGFAVMFRAFKLVGDAG